MTKPNFSTMTKSELKQYLIEHKKYRLNKSG